MQFQLKFQWEFILSDQNDSKFQIDMNTLGTA